MKNPDSSISSYQEGTQDVEGDEVDEGKHGATRGLSKVLGHAVTLDVEFGRACHHHFLPRLTGRRPGQNIHKAEINKGFL